MRSHSLSEPDSLVEWGQWHQKEGEGEGGGGVSYVTHGQSPSNQKTSSHPLQRPEGARQVFTGHTVIACTKREALCDRGREGGGGEEDAMVFVLLPSAYDNSGLPGTDPRRGFPKRNLTHVRQITII